MSPVSRGRKNSKTRARRGGPSLASVHAEMVRAFEGAATEDAPLDVGVLPSAVVGAWWRPAPPDDDDPDHRPDPGPDEALGLSAVQFAVQRGTPAAQAMLRAFAAVGATPELRAAADT